MPRERRDRETAWSAERKAADAPRGAQKQHEKRTLSVSARDTRAGSWVLRRCRDPRSERPRENAPVNQKISQDQSGYADTGRRAGRGKPAQPVETKHPTMDHADATRTLSRMGRADFPADTHTRATESPSSADSAGNGDATRKGTPWRAACIRQVGHELSTKIAFSNDTESQQSRPNSSARGRSG